MTKPKRPREENPDGAIEAEVEKKKPAARKPKIAGAAGDGGDAADTTTTTTTTAKPAKADKGEKTPKEKKPPRPKKGATAASTAAGTPAPAGTGSCGADAAGFVPDGGDLGHGSICECVWRMLVYPNV